MSVAATERRRLSGFWSGYWKSLKPLEVEEPIDVWVHRPLAYIVARCLQPTGVSPNLVTLLSILFGVAAGAAFLADFERHLQLGGLFLFLSAVLDCADGQLARMRGTSSRLGRMLDGVADMVVAATAVGAASWVVVDGVETPILKALTVLAAGATLVTGSFHTASYDHYKNLYLRMTSDRYVEGEDYETALARYRTRSREKLGTAGRLAWPFYLFYVKSQQSFIERFDPYTRARLGALPPHDPERARIYQRHAEPLMRLWRSWFGFGAMVFGVAAAAVLDILLWYMVLRLVVLNALFYGYMRPAQRMASRRAFEELSG